LKVARGKLRFVATTYELDGGDDDSDDGGAGCRTVRPMTGSPANQARGRPHPMAVQTGKSPGGRLIHLKAGAAAFA
jgi:hypothetical protein